jgi:hypothetical protein
MINYATALHGWQKGKGVVPRKMFVRRVLCVIDPAKQSAKKKHKRRNRKFCRMCHRFNHETAACYLTFQVGGQLKFIITYIHTQLNTTVYVGMKQTQ